MATTSIPHRWKYDVFVSFRGEDIRKNFMDHMFNDFKQKGIHAFRDDNDLPRGEYISPQLYKAIEESRFLIVIFSKNYASSSWCLRELVKILECKQMGEPKHEVQIIFYDVKPNVVKNQTESYAEAFDKHKKLKRPEVDEWEKALSEAANLSGWDLQDMTNGYEYKFINCISKDIILKLCDGPLLVGENLVGIDFHFDKLNLSHFVVSPEVNMLGICGISGIGKTTLAKAIYNLMHIHFEGSCFCEDVKDVKEVQMQMIGKILKTDGVGEAIMQRMACKPILLVLDDVNNLEQLEALAGSRNWFYPGSLIIFTGKDKQLLRSHKLDRIYEMESLDDSKALELFSLYAFGKRHPTKDFEELASQVIIHLQGHPLALKVFGRLLYDKSVDVWKSQLDRLQTYPNPDILKKLRPSFDSLASDQKRMFLDIACAFIGENKDFAASILDSSNRFANANIEVLVDKFLITVSPSNMSLQMHELIQCMAREIIREEFDMPGNHSRRLWISSEDDILNVNKVAEEVEVLVLLLKNNCQNIPIDGQVLTRMENLRILKMCFPKVEGRWQPFAVTFSGRLDLLSNKLRLLYWHGLPLESLPSDFYPQNIVAIDLSYSNIKQLWTTPKCLRRLKIMKLRYCCNLTTTPDFSEITNLEELDLEGCVNLVSVHPSIGMLKRLAVLNLRDCKRLQNFAGRVETDAITQLPSFVSSLINLESLSIGGQGRIQPRWWTSITAPFGLLSKKPHPQRSVSLEGLHMLKKLNLSYCNLEQVRESIGGLSCLKELYLNGNKFTSLPGSLSQLSHLQYLNVNGCKKLEVLPELPHSLHRINASDCTSLREVSGSSKDPIRHNDFRNCPKLFKNVTIDSEGSISKIQCLDSSITSQGSIHQLSAFLGYMGLETNSSITSQGFDSLDIAYHGNSIPEWFTNRSKGKHVKVELPSDWCYDKFRGYGACVVFKRKKPFKEFEGYSVKNFDGASLICWGYIPASIENSLVMGIQDSYMIWLRYRRPTQGWEEAKNFVTFSFFQENNEDIEVKECGVRLICGGDLQQDDVTNLSMFQDLPTLSQHGGALRYAGPSGTTDWSCYNKF